MDPGRRGPDGEVFQQLLRDARLGEAELRRRLEEAAAHEYWQRLNPACAIEGSLDGSALDVTPIDDRQRTRLAGGLETEGYFQAGSLVALICLAVLLIHTLAIH